MSSPAHLETRAPTMQPRRVVATSAASIAAPARVAAASPAGLLVALAVVHVLRPDLDPSWRPISEYALGAHGWLMTLAFGCWALGPIALAIAVRPAARTRGARIGLAMLVLGGVGPLLAAAFPTDPPGTRPDAMSGPGMVHATGAVLADFIPVAALVLTLVLTRSNGLWVASKARLRVTAAAAFVALIIVSVAMGVMMPETGELGPEVKLGWLMRAYVLACNGWVAVAAWATLSAEDPGRRQKD